MEHRMLGLPEYLGSRRHEDGNVVAVPAVAPRSFPMPASASPEKPPILEMEQRIDPIGALEIDIAPLASIPAAGPAARHEFLPAECNAAIATVPGTDGNPGPVYEHPCP